MADLGQTEARTSNDPIGSISSKKCILKGLDTDVHWSNTVSYTALHFECLTGVGHSSHL